MKDYSTIIRQWLSKLDNLRHKNAACKIALSEIVDKSVFSDFLLKAENIHNELMANDESIVLLMDSANELLAIPQLNNGKSVAWRKRKIYRLDEDIKTLAARLDKLQLLLNADIHKPDIRL